MQKKLIVLIQDALTVGSILLNNNKTSYIITYCLFYHLFSPPVFTFGLAITLLSTYYLHPLPVVYFSPTPQSVKITSCRFYAILKYHFSLHPIVTP